MFLASLVQFYALCLDRSETALVDLQELYSDSMQKLTQQQIAYNRLQAVLLFILTHYPRLYQPLVQGLGHEWGNY